MRLSELEAKRVGIWGAGREGRAAVAAVERAGGHVEVVATDEDRSSVERLAGCEVVIRSPGVSRYRPEVARMMAAGVALTTGTNLFFAEPRTATSIGVTGTKGKSTTSAMLAHLLRHSGAAIELGGNIGVPVLELLERAQPDFYVIELSSFQIADLERGPEVAVVLNLFREHVDWHGSEEAYAADKLRLLGLPGVRIAVVPEGDERVRGDVPGGRESRGFAAPQGLDAASLGLRGEHNVLNLGAALAVAEAVGVTVKDPASAMASFEPLPHRLEVVAAERDGVIWVNDSVATTPEATIAALRTFADRPVTLIAGGYDRGQDYTQLGRAIEEHPGDASLVTLPVTGARIATSVYDAAVRAGEAWTRAHPAGNLDEAVRLAAAVTPRGGVALLSPAAPSFGAFRDFEERGERYRAAVARSIDP